MNETTTKDQNLETPKQPSGMVPSPREVAEETLQQLILFTQTLKNMSYRASESALVGKYTDDFIKLIDGMEIFTDALTQAKRALRIGLIQSVAVLEADMTSVFRDILHYREARQDSYVSDLLREHLPSNLDLWHNEGLPTLIRSRDS